MYNSRRGENYVNGSYQEPENRKYRGCGPENQDIAARCRWSATRSWSRTTSRVNALSPSAPMKILHDKYKKLQTQPLGKCEDEEVVSYSPG